MNYETNERRMRGSSMNRKRDDVDTIHLVEYCGSVIETTVTRKASTAEKWIQNIMKSSSKPFDLLIKNDSIINAGHEYQKTRSIIIGLDCKYGIGAGSQYPIASSEHDSRRLATLQLCVDLKCLVLPLVHMDCISQAMKGFFSDSSITFTGVEMQKRAGKLSAEYDVSLGRKVDVRWLARTWFPFSCRSERYCSLKALALGIAGISVRKPFYEYCKGALDWESMDLDEDLIHQAAIDAYASYKIATKLIYVV